MKIVFKIALLFFPIFGFSQITANSNNSGNANEYLGQNYYDRGEFDKATMIYESLNKTSPGNQEYFKKLISCYQQLKQFDKAENAISTKLNRTKLPNLYIDLGYNFQLQKKQDKADKNYDLAIKSVSENPNNVYLIAVTFEQKSLLKQAIQAYELGEKLNPNFKFTYQIALLQGQLGNLELMTEKLLDYSLDNPMNLPLVQNQLLRFMAEDNQKLFTENLRKALLLRTQKTQDIFWNQFMSWFFVQQKEFGKAFTQEKAIFKRSGDNLGSIIGLAKQALDAQENETASEILNFILLNTNDVDLQIQAHYQLVSLQIATAAPKDFELINTKLNELLAKYGTNSNTIRLQLLKANFEGFYLNNFEKAKATLNHLMDLPLNAYQLSEVKLELGDLLLVNQKFNQSIIYYAQVQEDLPNDEIAHEAALKMAKASYYNSDFEWAQKQFTVLKGSTSQLIANDAMQMFLLISDNTVEDSTQVTLKKFCKADFLAYQNKNNEALQAFKTLLEQHRGQSIEDETLFRIAKLYEKQNDYNNAISFYQQIVDKHAEDIYIDEALFYSAEIYRKFLNSPDKAKPLYEKIIFNHPDSIYFVEAQTNYRKLRGDSNL